MASVHPPAVVVSAGLPAPLSVYGYNARGKGVEQHRPLRAETHLIAPVAELCAPVRPHVDVGAAVSAVLGNRDGPLEVRTRFTTLHAGLGFGPFAPGVDTPEPGAGLVFGAAPAIQFAHLFVDEGINLDTYALGARTWGRFAWPLWSGAPVAGALEVGWEYYGAPLDRTTYFNHRLGATSLVSLSLGVVVALSPSNGK